MGKHAGGRPKKWTQTKRENMLIAFRTFVDSRPFPVIETFCYRNRVWKQRLYEWEEFADSLKVCVSKATSYLIEKGLKARGGLKPAVVIFALKNMAGWRDQVNIEHSGAIDPVQGATPEDRRALIAALITKRNVDGN